VDVVGEVLFVFSFMQPWMTEPRIQMMLIMVGTATTETNRRRHPLHQEQLLGHQKRLLPAARTPVLPNGLPHGLREATWYHSPLKAQMDALHQRLPLSTLLTMARQARLRLPRHMLKRGPLAAAAANSGHQNLQTQFGRLLQSCGPGSILLGGRLVTVTAIVQRLMQAMIGGNAKFNLRSAER
jgi:hypothetical protein